MIARKLFTIIVVLFLFLLVDPSPAHANRKMRTNTDVMKDTKLNLNFRGRSDLDNYLKVRRKIRKAEEAMHERDLESYFQERQTRLRREKARNSEIRNQAGHSWRDKIFPGQISSGYSTDVN